MNEGTAYTIWKFDKFTYKEYIGIFYFVGGGEREEGHFPLQVTDPTHI